MLHISALCSVASLFAPLMLSIPGKNLADNNSKDFPLKIGFDISRKLSPEDQKMGFDIPYKLSSQETICMNVETHFLGKMRIISSVFHLLSIPREW